MQQVGIGLRQAVPVGDEFCSKEGALLEALRDDLQWRGFRRERREDFGAWPVQVKERLDELECPRCSSAGTQTN